MLNDFLWSMMRPFIFKLNPETAHNLSLFILKSNIIKTTNMMESTLSSQKNGLYFSNILGMAAGFDKNGEAIKGLSRLGFGSVEIGTVTPIAQEGNLKPRLFRSLEDQAVLNRMGFNNDGQTKIHQNLQNYRRRVPNSNTIIGVNIGANKASTNRINDYIVGMKTFYVLADYLTINISSPNTPGLRELQSQDNLKNLVEALVLTKNELFEKHQKLTPFFLKIAPDLFENQLEEVAAIILEKNLDGVIISNTTLDRKYLKNHQFIKEDGGVSGKPLFDRSTIVLAKMRKLLGHNKTIIGVGGISDGQSALEKIKAGADLIQIYSALIFNGPFIAKNILNELLKVCKGDGVKNVSEYHSCKVTEWANKALI